MINSTEKYNIPEWSCFEDREVKPETTMHYIEDKAYAIVYNEADDVGHYLHRLEVREEEQKKGYGKKLMEFIMERYKSIWFEPRNASHHFYLKLGAKPIATHCHGWIFAINDKLPSENWERWVGENVNFCKRPDDNFTYKEEEWPMKLLELLG